MLPKTTREVARMLGVSYNQIFNLLRFDKINPPARNGAGDYGWLPEDVKRAKKALQGSARRELVSA